MQLSIRINPPKLPNIDPLYFRQTKTLSLVHRESVELSKALFASRNANEAYDPESGTKRMKGFVDGIKARTKPLGEQRIDRILRRRSQQGMLTYKNELDRDIARVEVIQGNVEYEMLLLWRRKLMLCCLTTMVAVLSGASTMIYLTVKAMLWRGIL